MKRMTSDEMKNYEKTFDIGEQKVYFKQPKWALLNGLVDKYEYEETVFEMRNLELNVKPNLKEIGCYIIERNNCIIEYYEKNNESYQFLYENGELMSVLIIKRNEVI